MCIVSDVSLRKLLFPKEEHEKAKKLFERRDWKSIGGRILINPFELKNLGAFSYDLCVGNEAFALKANRRISIDEGKEVTVEPSGIFLILTQEYVGLPREFAGSVMPRFCLVREGVFQSMTKIDPTWFGKIAVAITNHSKQAFQLKQGQPFSTLVIHRLDRPCSKVLKPSDTPQLGKESIQYFLKQK